MKGFAIGDCGPGGGVVDGATLLVKKLRGGDDEEGKRKKRRVFQTEERHSVKLGAEKLQHDGILSGADCLVCVNIFHQTHVRK